MSTMKLVSVANETVQICERGAYRSSSGRQVAIGRLVEAAAAGTRLHPLLAILLGSFLPACAPADDAFVGVPIIEPYDIGKTDGPELDQTHDTLARMAGITHLFVDGTTTLDPSLSPKDNADRMAARVAEQVETCGLAHVTHDPGSNAVALDLGAGCVLQGELPIHARGQVSATVAADAKGITVAFAFVNLTTGPSTFTGIAAISTIDGKNHSLSVNAQASKVGRFLFEGTMAPATLNGAPAVVLDGEGSLDNAMSPSPAPGSPYWDCEALEAGFRTKSYLEDLRGCHASKGSLVATKTYDCTRDDMRSALITETTIESSAQPVYEGILSTIVAWTINGQKTPGVEVAVGSPVDCTK
jgi:hypothetical protein